MARQGEGDPRWVVRERQDGRNVNSWHWEDKDVTSWAQTRLKELIAPDPCRTTQSTPGVAVASVETVEGDATLYNRKGVLKVLYDLKIAGKWSSLHAEEGDRTYGEFKIDLFDDDPEVVVSIDSKSKSDSTLKHAFVKHVSPLVAKQCTVFVSEMHSGAGQSVDGLQVPQQKKKTKQSSVTHYTSTKDAAKTDSGKKANLVELVLHDMFTCSQKDWFMAMTDTARLSAITRSKVVSDARPGGKFDLLNGVASGEYISLASGEHIEMRWKLKNWGDDAAHGHVRINMNAEEGKTEVVVRLNDVPKGLESMTEGFWRVQIFQAMKVIMGWGSASKFV